MAQMHCPKCGELINDDSKFCPFCGFKFNLTTKDSTSSSRTKNERIIIALLIVLIVLVATGVGVMLLNGNHDGKVTLGLMGKDDPYLIRADGVGDIVLGMTPLETFVTDENNLSSDPEIRMWSDKLYDRSEAVSGMDCPIVTLYKGGEPLCSLYYDDVLSFIWVESELLHTSDGVHVGMKAEELFKKYGITHVRVGGFYTDMWNAGFTVRIPNSDMMVYLDGDWMVDDPNDRILNSNFRNSDAAGEQWVDVPISCFEGRNAHVSSIRVWE